MYPALPSGNGPAYAYGNNAYGGTSNAAGPSYAPQPAALNGMDNSPWSAAENSTLRVKIADEYRLAPPVPMPLGLAASTRPQQEFDYDFERQVMSNDASTSYDAFLSKPEDVYYENTKAGRFIRAGFSPATVNLALAYHATNRLDESQITAFCDNFRTLTEDMSFDVRLAAGALLKTNNDLAAAANLITELS